MPYSLFMFPSTMCFLGSPVKLYNCVVLCFYTLSKLQDQIMLQRPNALGWVLQMDITDNKKGERVEIWSLLNTSWPVLKCTHGAGISLYSCVWFLQDESCVHVCLAMCSCMGKLVLCLAWQGRREGVLKKIEWKLFRETSMPAFPYLPPSLLIGNVWMRPFHSVLPWPSGVQHWTDAVLKVR